MAQAKRKTRSSVAAPERVKETAPASRADTTSIYNDTITRRGGQGIVIELRANSWLLNSWQSPYCAHFCAICCIAKVFTPSFGDTSIVELHNKSMELYLIQRHNLFDSRLLFYNRSGNPLFQLLLVGGVAEGRCSSRRDIDNIPISKHIFCQKDSRSGINFSILHVINPHFF